MSRLVLLVLIPWLTQAQVMLRPNPLDVATLSLPDPTKAYLRSGFDPSDGNSDAGNLIRVDPAGTKFSDPQAEWVMFESAGPGVITSMWLSGRDKMNKIILNGQMNFYFDGEKIPSFSAELPALFEAGALFPKPLAEKTPEGWVNYAPLFYSKSLKITLTNHEDRYLHRQNAKNEAVPVLFHQFSYQKLPGPVKSTRLGQEKFPTWKRADGGEKDERMIEVPENIPGQVLGEWNGRGILNSLRLRWMAGDPDDAVLTIWCDGRKTVSMKMSELFAVSRKHRPGARFRSLLLGFEDDTYYCYFPMAHRRSLRILIDQPGSASVKIDTLHQKTWPERDHYYFRAERVNEQTVPGKDVVLLKASGAGHYVGALLEWSEKMAEGDDRFYVDGETFPPAWHGTGTDDYFRGVVVQGTSSISRPVYGVIGAAAPRIGYRLHIADRVNFSHGCVIGFEHGSKNDFTGTYRGVVFWYSAN